MLLLLLLLLSSSFFFPLGEGMKRRENGKSRKRKISRRPTTSYDPGLTDISAHER
jgi:hypothetical protein